MICTEDEDFYPIGHEWNFHECSVTLTEVIDASSSYDIVCDITINGQHYYEQVLSDGTTYTYGAYTITCAGFIGAGDGSQLAQIIICTESEANQILTIYFRPYPWSSNSGAASLLSSKAIKLAGGFANAFSGISGHEYIDHEIVVEKPEFSGIDLVGVRIYLFSTESPTSPQFIFGGLGIAAVVLVVAILAGSLAYVGNKWQDIMATWTYKYPIVVRDANKQYSENVGLRIENGCYKVNNGEMTPDEFIVLLRDIIKENTAHRNMISPKNSSFADDDFELRIENAIAQYNADGNFDSLCTNATSAAQTRANDDKAETEDKYDPGDLPDLEDTDEWLTYLMYGGMALGGIMLAPLGIQFIDTVKGK